MSIKPLEQFEFHQTLESTEGEALVFFSSDECSSCKFWEKLLREFHASNNKQTLQIFKIDAGKDHGLTEEFGVFHLPALFLYHNGQFHSDLQCEADPESIRSAINHALTQPAKESP